MARERDVVAAHAAIAPRDLLVRERRDLYALVAQLGGVGDEAVTGMLDSPVAHAALGRFLSGADDLRAVDLVPLGELSARSSRGRACALPIASGPAARRHLAPAVAIVAGQAAPLDPATAPTLLGEDDEPAFDRAVGVVAAGLDLAADVDPELIHDLVPHVALVAVLRRDSAGRLGSASTREYPGLVLMPDPETALEAAEALVHEGAHQKLFDLAVTRDVLGRAARAAPAFRPSWTAGRPWPLEQVLAAWHAYTGLARFWNALPDRHRAAVHGDSLLPDAKSRAAELAEQLSGRGHHLGRDAHDLLAHATGRRPTDEAPTPEGALDDITRWLDDGTLVHRRTGDGTRCVAGRAGRPPAIFWVDDVDLDRVAVRSRR